MASELSYGARMRGKSGLFVGVADRARLAAIVADRNSAQKHVWRAEVVLLSADRLGTAEIMRRTGLSKPSVWRWQERYLAAGVDGLLRDRTRPSRIPALSPRQGGRGDRPDPGRAAARRGHAAGRCARWPRRAASPPAKVHEIWQEAGLAPHRVRRFKLSTDPAFAEKLGDVVGLYIDPPRHAIVLSLDEKSQVQALDRSPAPALPMKPGRAGTMHPRLQAQRHDHAVCRAQRARRHGGRRAAWHATGIRNCLRFLNAIEREDPRPAR